MRSILFALLLWNFTKAVIAVPSAFASKCNGLDIVNETTSTILRDNEDCNIAWVLPPTFGLVSLNGYSPNGNLTLCQEVKDVQVLSKNLVARIAKIYEEIDGLRVEYTEKERTFLEAKKKLSEIERSPEIKEISNIEDQILQSEKRIEKLIEQLGSCAENCRQINDELIIKREERIHLKQVISNLKYEYFEVSQQHRNARAEMDSAQYALDNIGANLFTLSDKQMKLKVTLQQWLLFYSKLEGGFAHLDYDSQWTENTVKLNNKYGGKYHFKQIPTRNARINANFIGSNDKDSYLSSMPAILDYVISGVKFTPWGENGTIGYTALPSRISGSVRLSLIGACPLYYKDFLESNDLIKNDVLNQKMNFSITATYEYPAAFKFDVSAKYNLYKFYNEISQASSDGGLFTIEHYNNIIKDSIDNDSFTIEWNLEEAIYTSEQKEEIRRALKADLVARVLISMATPIFSNIPSFETAPIRTESGAIVIANGIDETCAYFDLFCHGVVWIIRGIDGIFGGSSAESRYREQHDKTAQESWKVSETRWRAAATGFVGDR